MEHSEEDELSHIYNHGGIPLIDCNCECKEKIGLHESQLLIQLGLYTTNQTHHQTAPPMEYETKHHSKSSIVYDTPPITDKQCNNFLCQLKHKLVNQTKRKQPKRRLKIRTRKIR